MEKAASVLKENIEQTNKFVFNKGEFIVYPVHGVGKIIDIEERSFDNISSKFLVIHIEQEKLTLRVPVNNVEKLGLRPVITKDQLKEIEEILKQRVRVRRVMWSRRAQEYETKINSGNPFSIAEVVRELYKKNDFEQSYSERQIYQLALVRLAREISIVYSIDEESALIHLKGVLDAA